MAELHVIGQLVGGYDFHSCDLFCKWGLAHGSNWNVIEGKSEGQTQVDHPKDGTFAKWSHPIDLHLSCQGLQGWPKLHFQVWHEDIFGRNELYGYGFIHVPTVPGNHEVDCVIWKPVGSFMDQVTSFFMGGGPELSQESLVHSSEDRLRLRTESSGRVRLKLGIIIRNFEKFGVETS
ncbi:PREDICTED: B9 domain-containing protein 2-like [Amphimedon queenslandica]|uniref:B9 domain-containing protein 2 n=1 Tax=Amphimedon queenslandica TaxID=400682 RepID=A0A1X7VNE4_AMPQE|nr:PREDICTED: B9 domain-containing protein 2-like [Amphimedon queenslandica]|eukprot:XP_011409625.1 PREDICTED: B9 domain-containing protein 2-like [Amphimedon queenslandica]